MFERGEMIEQRQCRLTPPVLALPRKVAAQEQPGVAMIAEKQIRLRDDRLQDRRRIGLPPVPQAPAPIRSEEHTSELQSLMRISYAVFFLTKKQATKQLIS